MVYFISDKQYLNIGFLTYVSVFWIVSSFFTEFYKVYRFTKIYRIVTLLAVQISVFFLGYFAYFGIFKEGEVIGNQAKVLSVITIGIVVFKFSSFYILKKYRSVGKNYRKIIILGQDDTSKKMIDIFKNKKHLGYQYAGYFSNTEKEEEECLGKLNNSFDYILKNGIDEMYCTLSVLSKSQLKEFTKFANKNSKIIKLIPNSNELYNKSLKTEYYEDTMVLSVKTLPLENSNNHFVKRIFDVVFSFLVCVVIMSWLTPLLWLLIKMESKGPALFKQQREGLGGYHFTCYKFRSMKINYTSNKLHATKSDKRVTALGSFLRKTSIDELPQFFNVLKGDMSVVGPRPHMSSLSFEYQKEIENYMERYVVRPGITGLAQASGYRGEVIKHSDIKNRIRLDIFYIENWSIFLDLKIIFQTVINIFKGEEKAY